MLNEKKVVKLGVLGLYRGLQVTKEIAKDSNVVVRGICDKNPERLATAKRELEDMGVKDMLIFDKYEDLLASDVDTVYIATDAPIHTGQVIMALDAGKHVISEIPTIDTIDDARRLKAATKRHPELKYMTGENCCFWAFIETWKSMYENGDFGEAVYVEGEYLHACDPNKFVPLDKSVKTWRTSHDAIKYLTHELGPILYILGDRPVSVTCFEPDIRYNPNKSGSENGIALIKTAKGAVIRIFIGFGAYVGFDHNFALYGTRGSIVTDKTKPLDDAHSFAKLHGVPGTLDAMIDIPVTTKYVNEESGGHGGCDRKMMRAFIKCIIDDTKPPIDVDLGIRMSIPGIIAHESALKGGVPLEIPEID